MNPSILISSVVPRGRIENMHSKNDKCITTDEASNSYDHEELNRNRGYKGDSAISNLKWKVSTACNRRNVTT